MKHTLFLIIAFWTTSILSAQNTPEIVFNENKEILLNGQKIDADTDLETIQSILGEPVLYKEYVTGKVNYHFPELGIAVHIVNGNLTFIGANFNWDGDETFPETTYTGKLLIDSIEFNKSSTNEILSKITVVDFVSLIPGLYMTNPKIEEIATMIGFKDDKLTQVGFQFQ